MPVPEVPLVILFLHPRRVLSMLAGLNKRIALTEYKRRPLEVAVDKLRKCDLETIWPSKTKN